ncbi:MAG: hypothetical protein GDA48_21875 [Hormoscilla sp. GM102CHS1]|nr:hypothetical protein [Hormoscilla sp. GM102CHS1]
MKIKGIICDDICANKKLDRLWGKRDRPRKTRSPHGTRNRVDTKFPIPERGVTRRSQVTRRSPQRSTGERAVPEKIFPKRLTM